MAFYTNSYTAVRHSPSDAPKRPVTINKANPFAVMREQFADVMEHMGGGCSEYGCRVCSRWDRIRTILMEPFRESEQGAD